MAAERGDATLQATRQAYWAAMSPAEQALSLAMGERLRRHYGDAAALARAEGAQRRHAGRRIGLGGFSGVEPSSSGPALVTPHHLVVAAAPTR